MRFMGQARASIVGTFPLVGVLPAEKIMVPDGMPDLELESNHTHFVFSPGKEWGDESPWLARVASELSGDTPSLTLLANGGNIAWRDVAASLAQGRPVVVMAGSGRTADILAGEICGHTENQQLPRAFATNGLLPVLDINSGTHALTQGLLSLLKLNLVEAHSEMFTGKGLQNGIDAEVLSVGLETSDRVEEEVYIGNNRP
jgi:SLOG in TRPM, prokaryote